MTMSLLLTFKVHH